MKMPFNASLRPCDIDQWVNYVSDFRTFHTEDSHRSGHSVMYSKISPFAKDCKFSANRIIAEAHYLPDGSKQYFILGQ